MNELNTLFVEILELGSIEVNMSINPEFLKNSSGTKVKVVPNSSLQFVIPNTKTRENLSYNVSKYMLDNFRKTIKNLIHNPVEAQITIPDNEGHQLKFSPIYSTDKVAVIGFTVSLLAYPDDENQVSLEDLQNLLEYLNKLNINLAEAVLINQFLRIKDDTKNNKTIPDAN